MNRGSRKKEVDAEEECEGTSAIEFELPVPVPVNEADANANGHGNGASGSERDIERGGDGEASAAGTTETTKRGALNVEQGGGGAGEGGDEEEGGSSSKSTKWPGNETFFCNGQCVTGPNYWGIVGTGVLIFVPVAIFVALVAFPMFEELGRGPGAAVLLAASFLLPSISMASLFCSGCMDPGIIPRTPPPNHSEHIARTRNVEVNGHMVIVRYNETCNFYQPPRAHHCRSVHGRNKGNAERKRERERERGREREGEGEREGERERGREREKGRPQHMLTLRAFVAFFFTRAPFRLCCLLCLFSQCSE